MANSNEGQEHKDKYFDTSRNIWQNDRKDNNNMPPDLRSRGHKDIFKMKVRKEKKMGKKNSIGRKAKWCRGQEM